MSLFAEESQPTTGLTAVFDPVHNTVKIKWQQADPFVIQYILQRSSDNQVGNDLARLTINDLNRGKFVRFSDQTVAQGRNYYRLKSFTSLQTYSYSQAIMVIIGKKTGSSWIMFPVPVTDVLNLQYNGRELITGVITIIILNVNTGQVLNRMRVASTTRFLSIPVNNLGRGIYDIRIYIGDNVVWNQRFNK